MSRHNGAVVLSLAVLSLATSGAVSAASITWQTIGTTNWNLGTNWSGGSIPTATDSVSIPGGGNQPQITAGGTAQNLTLSAAGSALTVQSGQALVIATGGGTSSISNAGTLTLGPSGVNNTDLQLSGANGTVNLTGAGSLVMSGPNAEILTNQTGITLNNASTIQGQGLISVGSLGNTGTLNANISGGTLEVICGCSNSGVMKATSGGTLLIFNSPLDNTGGTILADGGTVDLKASVTGGTLSTANAGTIEINNTGANLLGTININGTVNVSNSAILSVFDGAELKVNGSSGGGLDIATGSKISLTGNATFSGDGAVTLHGGAQISGGAGSTLTNSATIQGEGLFGVNVINSGTVNANVSGKKFFDSTITNTGTLEATNGGNLWLISPDNTGGLIKADGAGSIVTLNGTVTNGTLTASNGGLISALAGGPSTLAGTMTLNGPLSVGTGASLTLAPGLSLTNNGSITVAADSSGIVIDSTGATFTLSGSGKVTLAGPGITPGVNNGGGNILNNSSTIEGSGDLHGFDTINNTGLVHANGGALLDINGTFNNMNNIEVDLGSSATFHGGIDQTAGNTDVEGTLSAFSQGFKLEGGTVTGTGTINGNFSNTGGTVTPGDDPGTLTLTGAYSQGSGGTLEIDLLSNAVFSQLLATGAYLPVVDLDGILRFVALNGYAPSTNQFLVISAPNGDIMLEKSLQVIFPNFAGWNFSLTESNDLHSLYLNVSQQAVPEPSSIALSAIGAGLLLFRRLRRKAA